MSHVRPSQVLPGKAARYGYHLLRRLAGVGMSDDARAVLDAYFAQSEAKQRLLRQTKPTDSSARAVLKNLVPVRYRGTARMLLTDVLRARERRKAQAIMRSPGLRLHLGSGGEHKSGWVNIDLLGDPVELAWNLAIPLPFESGSADAVFHEHLLEHLPLPAGATLMRECHRVLKPGGILRVGVPDAGKLVRSYAGERGYLEALHLGCPTAMLAVQELFYWHRHCAMFDAETLRLFFAASGFADPRERGFGESDLGPAPDTDRRRAETLYMEARKPTGR
jgi:SAM-dependent methyltransferase